MIRRNDMDIREAMLELVNSESVRYSYMAIEKIIIVMMRDYLKAQNKRLLAENEVMHRISDMILPDGIDNEDGYIAAEIKLYRHMLEPYNWANISQLNYMINNTCLFIGLSMTDPNMRRLLEIAAQKRIENDSDCQHYAIMRRFRMKESAEVDSIKSFERVNETLQESFFKELGVNVIWIDEFSEIPAILKQIKGNYESY